LALIASAFALALLPSGAAASELPVPDRDPETVRRLADDILSRPEFRRPQPSLFDRVMNWISDRIASVFDALGGGGSNALSWIVLVVAAVAAIYALVRIGRTVRRDPSVHEAVAVDVDRSAADWRAEADRLEAQGKWKDALRCRYRALVADLVDRGVVQDVAGRTTGEYRREVASTLPTHATEFAGATELFERAWYGDEPTGEDESEQFRALSDGVLARSGR
jgi:hypothetical protein